MDWKALCLLLPGLLPVLLPAAEPPPSPPAGGGWNAATAPRAAAPEAPQAPLDVTVYPGWNPGRGPGGGRDQPPLAVDVRSVTARCPDGSVIVTAMVIGGQLTPLDNRCPGNAPSNPLPAASQPPAAAPDCDANRWNCSTGPPPR